MESPMPQERPQWTKAEELKRLLMEEPTAVKEYLRTNFSNIALRVARLRAAVRSLNRALSDLSFKLPSEDDRERC